MEAIARTFLTLFVRGKSLCGQVRSFKANRLKKEQKSSDEKIRKVKNREQTLTTFTLIIA